MNVPAVPAPDITLIYTHQAYRALAAPIAGAITPEVKAELWAKAEVNAKKRRSAVIEELRSDAEAHRTDPFEKIGQAALSAAVDVDALVEAHEPVNVLTEAAKAEPQAEAAAGDESQHSHEPVAIERPGGEHTIGIPVVSETNPAPVGMVAVQVAPDMIEAAQAVEVKTLEDVLAELGKAKAELAQRNDTIRRLLDSRKELEKQLDTLGHSQRMTPLNGAVEIMTLFQDILLVEQRNAADKELAALLAANWQLVPQLCASDLIRRTVFLQRQTRMVEPKPDADKPGNVRDFPVPDAELTAEDEGTVSARASGLPVSSSYGMGRGLAPRRA